MVLKIEGANDTKRKFVKMLLNTAITAIIVGGGYSSRR